MIDETTQEVSARSRPWWPWIVITGAIAIIAVVVHSPLLAVETVQIEGASRSDAAGRLADAGVGAGALLLYVDAGEVERALLQDPWILDARVERIWPDAVIVEVLERKPLVWIEGATSWMLVSRDGTVLTTATEPSTGLMRAAVAFPDRAPGDEPIDPAWSEIVAMALVLGDDIGGTLELEMRGPELWTRAFGHEVRLGHPIDLADKGRTMRAMLADEPPEGAILDVSSALRPALILRESEPEVETSDDGA